MSEKISLLGSSIKLESGATVFLGIKEGSGDGDGYYVKFESRDGEIRKFRITDEAFDALLALKPHVDLQRHRPEVWMEVRSEFKETTPEAYENPGTDQPEPPQ